MVSLRSASLAFSVTSAAADNWAVIAAGSKGYNNYRHQADACHAFQVVKAKGIPEENIILMMFDDVASHEDNPIPGKLFNKPDPSGLGVDVHENCRIDYHGLDVTPEKYMAVLQGDHSSAGGKVLNSTAEDNVYLFFSDHGAPGLMAFPDDALHVTDLQKTLKTMSERKMFKKLVFYLETCYSGTMFEGLDVPGVYALSAANTMQSSWGAYCGSESIVNGIKFSTCLGDAFSAAWMEDSDARDLSKETLQEQFETVRGKTERSQVMQWGDLSFVNDSVAMFLGDKGSALGSVALGKRSKNKMWKTKDAHLKYVMDKYNTVHTGVDRLKFATLVQEQLKEQVAIEKVHRRFAEIAYPGDTETQKLARRRMEKPASKDCELDGHRALKKHCKGLFQAESGFALWFHQVIVNVCHDVASGLNLSVRGAVEIACKDAAGEEALV